jgi:hypothetical protein
MGENAFHNYASVETYVARDGEYGIARDGGEEEVFACCRLL